jgi:hypothetical protein
LGLACAEEVIANCDVLITRFSSTTFVGIALGKETHSDFDSDQIDPQLVSRKCGEFYR